MTPADRSENATRTNRVCVIPVRMARRDAGEVVEDEEAAHLPVGGVVQREDAPDPGLVAVDDLAQASCPCSGTSARSPW